MLRHQGLSGRDSIFRVKRCARLHGPKSLRDPLIKQQRFEALRLPHLERLTSFVLQLREEMGPEYAIPFFDPADGGADAAILHLLEAPGRRAIESGLVSRDNPDETSKNFLLLNIEAGIDRKLTVCWNIVPWYIGSDTKIRAANSKDTASGARSFNRVISLLHALKVVVFLGSHAAKAGNSIRSIRPDVDMVAVPHPSPLFINRLPGNRARVLSALKQVASKLYQ